MALLQPPVEVPWDWKKAIADAVNGTTTRPGVGGTPPPSDYGILYGIPGFAAGIGAVDANESTAARARANAIKAALVQFGVVPPGWQSGYGDVDQATLDAASQNPFSTLKTLLDTQHRGGQDLEAQLAARGVLSSGALTGGYDVLQRSHDRSLADETNKLLANLSGYETTYAGSVNDQEAKRAELIQNAALAAGQNPDILAGIPATPRTPTTYAAAGVTPGAITSDMVKPPVITRSVVKPPVVSRPPRRRRSYASVPSSIGSYVR